MQYRTMRISVYSFIISAEYAKEFAESEFEKYRVIQDKLFSSDFDKFNSSLPFDDDKN